MHRSVYKYSIFIICQGIQYFVCKHKYWKKDKLYILYMLDCINYIIYHTETSTITFHKFHSEYFLPAYFALIRVYLLRKNLTAGTITLYVFLDILRINYNLCMIYILYIRGQGTTIFMTDQSVQNIENFHKRIAINVRTYKFFFTSN